MYGSWWPVVAFFVFWLAWRIAGEAPLVAQQAKLEASETERVRYMHKLDEDHEKAAEDVARELRESHWRTEWRQHHGR